MKFISLADRLTIIKVPKKDEFNIFSKLNQQAGRVESTFERILTWLSKLQTKTGAALSLVTFLTIL